MATVAERFWKKVRLPVSPDGCLEWIGARQPSGYGHMNVAGKFVKAHRLAHELLVGPIPSGMVVDHLCRNRACVNPNHLEPVTQRTNVHRGDSAMAKKVRQTHCHQGHELAGENLRVDSYGRHCRACALKRDRDRYASKKKG